MGNVIGVADYAGRNVEKAYIEKAQGQKKVKKVMDEWKHGTLHSGSKKGPEVTSQKQAVAIALSEAGLSKAIENNFKKGLIDDVTYLKALVQLDNLIEKGGEGSRGGKVISHTKTGKPVYENFNHESHKNFSSDDHRDAAKYHTQRGRLHGEREQMYYTLNSESKNDAEKKYTQEGTETHAHAKQHHYINADLHHEQANIMDAEKNKEHLKNKLEGNSKGETIHGSHMNDIVDRIHKRGNGNEKTVNDEIHFGVGEHPYAYKKTLDQAGISHTVSKNPLFGHIKDKDETKKLLKHLKERDGYLSVDNDKGASDIY